MVGFNRKRMQDHPKVKSLLDLLDKITDVPACILFKVNNDGQKTFFVPQRTLDPLRTGIVPYSRICSKRIKKYQERGFTFSNDQIKNSDNIPEPPEKLF